MIGCFYRNYKINYNCDAVMRTPQAFNGWPVKAIRRHSRRLSPGIRGFNRSHIYSLERLKHSLNRLRKDRNTNWRVKVMEHSPLQGFSMRGFPAKLEGEEGEEQFWFEGGSDADRRVRVEIQGAWLHNLPWDRAA
jgi:hypothetical protein